MATVTTQKITIEPVTRIEGHAKITIRLNEAGKVERAYLHINEFRGFEKFCEGRMAFEMPVITPAFAASARFRTTWAPPRLVMTFMAVPRHGQHNCYANSCTWGRSSKATACTSLNWQALTSCWGSMPIRPPATWWA